MGEPGIPWQGSSSKSTDGFPSREMATATRRTTDALLLPILESASPADRERGRHEGDVVKSRSPQQIPVACEHRTMPTMLPLSEVMAINLSKPRKASSVVDSGLQRGAFVPFLLEGEDARAPHP